MARLHEKAIYTSISAEARLMAAHFFDSDLGKLSQAASMRETEFPILTHALVDGQERPVKGQIDLLFEIGDRLVIVDFKTDRLERPEEHFGQLALYRQAVEDIFEKEAEAWIFYLRSPRGGVYRALRD
jgi:ATP-dependent helicase/nuclease subunit A